MYLPTLLLLEQSKGWNQNVDDDDKRMPEEDSMKTKIIIRV